MNEPVDERVDGMSERGAASAEGEPVVANGLQRDRLLQAYLEGVDAPCPVCGYNLRGLAAPRCPECNAPLSLGVTSENLSIGPWAVAVVAFAMGAGFDSVVSTLMTIGLIAEPTLQWQPYAMYAILVSLALACLASIVVLVKRRRRWAFKTRAAQWRCAIACFVGVFLAHALVGAIIAFVVW